jgi:peptidoglycan/LPS O-acetylase OafA/YrhL
VFTLPLPKPPGKDASREESSAWMAQVNRWECVNRWLYLIAGVLLLAGFPNRYQDLHLTEGIVRYGVSTIAFCFLLGNFLVMRAGHQGKRDFIYTSIAAGASSVVLALLL